MTQGRADAIRQIEAAARFLRQWDPFDPTPYLLIRALRWGNLNAIPLSAPPAEVREEVEFSYAQRNWRKLLESAESAMSVACGWLDLQFYAVRACSRLGRFYNRSVTP